MQQVKNLKFSMTRVYVAVLLLLPGFLSAQNGVNRDELNTANGTVDFENNVNQPDTVNTRDEIRQIGTVLADGIQDEQGERRRNVRIGPQDRYSMIEAIGRGNEGGLSADIIELGGNAGVDHIRNLRTIISGFLENSYNYTREEADELAVLVTVYNAVNRKNITRFTEKYRKSVAARLDKNRVGLAVSFREWPGKTQIVIPLFNPAGDDNYQISVEAIVEDKKVREALEKEAVKIDVERAVREQKAREETAKQEAEAAKRRAEEERLARERSARLAAEDAARRVGNTERSLAAAIERLRQETERLVRFEEETVQARNEAEKARREIVRNKFGIPLAGNEAAAEKDAQLANLEKRNERQQTVIENARQELADLERMLEDARIEAANAARYAGSLN
jgi:hypothetical protein